MPAQLPRTAHLMASPDDVEQQFYEALREGDLDKLMAVWADDDEVVCVHPGGPRVVGPQAIRAAFEAIFSQGTVQAHPGRVRRVQTVDAAMHSLIERVTLQHEGQTQTAYVAATNVYIRSAQGWRLVAHHASPGTRNETPEVSETPSVLH